MSREQAAACPLAADQLPLLVLGRHVPERSLPELLSASGRVGDSVRLALFHVRVCDGCSETALCERGARLIDACHGWRERA